MKELCFILLFTLLFSASASADSSGYHRPSVIHLDSELDPKDPWLRSSDTPESAIRRLLQYLEDSDTGEVLLNKARKKAKKSGKSLMDILEVGKSSLLDTTLVRRFTPDRPNRIHYEMKSKILINRRHITMNAILDLAHELTHYTLRDPFNPYETEFTASEFVRSTVEGKGGEVEAYLIECKVLDDLFPTYSKKMSNCDRVRDEKGKLSKSLGIQEFYKVGEHYRIFSEAAETMNVSTEKFAQLSREESQFISSAYGLPYPVAAIKEFQIIMGKVCQNDERRISLMEDEGAGRKPASEGIDLSQLVENHEKRCQNFL